MQEFVRRQNIEHYEKLLKEALDPEKRKLILGLLAEEKAKEAPAKLGKD